MPLAKPKNQEKLAKDMAKLERWLDKTVERKSARHEANLRRALNKVLRSEEASRYFQVLQDVVLQQPSHRQRELIKKTAPVTPDNDKVTDPPQDAGTIFLGLFESLVQSVILQVRADIRNIFIWVCAGAPGSKNRRINGSDAFSSKALQDDVAAISHANGKHSLSAIIDLVLQWS
jgi:hypothetical protein